ncbi:MAG: hypothetical protein H7Y38_19185 [Armatimonadetes bacterium]|nr:hypothetical protein [Armatimonadota bacterium]
MTPQPKTELPGVPRRVKRRMVRRHIHTAPPNPPVPQAFVPRHREETRISPNGTVFRVSVPLNDKGEPYTAAENIAFFQSLDFDPEVWDAVMKNINDAREAGRKAPDGDEETEH